MKYFYLILLLLSIGCICSKENIMTKNALTGKYWLLNDTMTIFLKIDSCAEVCIYKKNASEIRHLITRDSWADFGSDSLLQMSDTSRFFIKKARSFRFAKKILDYNTSLNKKIIDKENCGTTVELGLLDGLNYHLIIQNSLGMFGNSDYSPQYYLDKCNNSYEKEFLEMVNEFHKLIGAPKIKPVPAYIFPK
ncbi:MAG: hypothetical protein IPN94_07110 [Sphingobacteriales bacterium]|jgi:hypothetical protein|nr:hypothetical protein [Sphingobacteriales bacterium]